MLWPVTILENGRSMCLLVCGSIWDAYPNEMTKIMIFRWTYTTLLVQLSFWDDCIPIEVEYLAIYNRGAVMKILWEYIVYSIFEVLMSFFPLQGLIWKTQSIVLSILRNRKSLAHIWSPFFLIYHQNFFKRYCTSMILLSYLKELTLWNNSATKVSSFIIFSVISSGVFT